MGVPIRSWGRYPSRGTALIKKQSKMIISSKLCSTKIYSREENNKKKKVFVMVIQRLHPPLIYILKHTVGCVGGGEDTFIRGDSGSWAETNIMLWIFKTIILIIQTMTEALLWLVFCCGQSDTKNPGLSWVWFWSEMQISSVFSSSIILEPEQLTWSYKLMARSVMLLIRCA